MDSRQIGVYCVFEADFTSFWKRIFHDLIIISALIKKRFAQKVAHARLAEPSVDGCFFEVQGGQIFR